MSETYQVTINVSVHDREALKAAAATHALKFMSADDWENLRASAPYSTAADLQMMFDPGPSPDGTAIEICEVHDIED